MFKLNQEILLLKYLVKRKIYIKKIVKIGWKAVGDFYRLKKEINL